MKHSPSPNSLSLAPLGAEGLLPAGAVAREVERHRAGAVARVRDAVAEEIPVALVYNGRPHAVMMATPADYEDFALGFSLSEAIIDQPVQCEKVEKVEALAGVELHLAIPASKAALIEQRARELTGRSGCGLCGTPTLDAAVRHPPPVADSATINEDALQCALAALTARQTLSAATGAVHAAAWANSDGEIVLLREDVARGGFAIITSRASFEMVMKAATVGIGFLAAISAPTALAIALARESNVTLIGFARADGYAIYAHAQRLRRVEPGARGIAS
ncbi:MAG: sulfurtransferase FdhD [Gammaproteobacteria bacterium]|nr:MAG: sulfurtransferase FdhD [Gammaproteobacteria bacterium]